MAGQHAAVALAPALRHIKLPDSLQHTLPKERLMVILSTIELAGIPAVAR